MSPRVQSSSSAFLAKWEESVWHFEAKKTTSPLYGSRLQRVVWRIWRSKNLINRKRVKFYWDIDVKNNLNVFLSWRKKNRQKKSKHIFDKKSILKKNFKNKYKKTQIFQRKPCYRFFLSEFRFFLFSKFSIFSKYVLSWLKKKLEKHRTTISKQNFAPERLRAVSERSEQLRGRSEG